ncbi:hypothetical protein [Bacteroides uniformis]|uniref:hypothetical protein n=1 Tax=Bacteroides uniformis TaxID=820 RepID=UPI00374E0290
MMRSAGTRAAHTRWWLREWLLRKKCFKEFRLTACRGGRHRLWHKSPFCWKR